MTFKPFVLISMMLIALPATNTLAEQVYKWRDENGKLHFSTVPPKEVSGEAKAVDLPKQHHGIDSDHVNRKLKHELNRTERLKERQQRSSHYRTRQHDTYDENACRAAREQYRNARANGVKAYQASTGKIIRVDGPEAQPALERMQQRIDLYCQ